MKQSAVVLAALVVIAAPLHGQQAGGSTRTNPSAEKRAWDIPTTTLGRTGVQVQVIAQGGARMDLHSDIPSAAEHVRQVYELGVRYFDCAPMYWNGQSEEAYGLGLQGVRKHVFLTSQVRRSHGQRRREGAGDVASSLEDRLRGSLADALHPGP